MSVWAIVAAAGAGTRMGAQRNKTLLPVGGVPAVCRAVRALRAACDGVILATQPQERGAFAEALSAAGLSVDGYADGGDTRPQTVRNALAQLPEDCSVVLIHDGARPLLTPALACRVVQEASLHGSAIPALPVTDTVKEVVAGQPARTLDRETLRAVQTPQGFRTGDLLEAYRLAGDGDFTDDAAVLEAAGYPIHFVEGERTNIKLTTGEDLALAEALCNTGTVRTGTGYDVHRLVEGRELILCGVSVPFDRGLLGHSDADVGAHAVIDALLGAAALGDIGTHFPDTDPAYRGADSLTLLRQTVRMLADQGFAPGNVDVTLVAQRPRLAPYVGQMRSNLAQASGLPIDCVSVKAKTNEGLGFEGRGEGISAHASATVKPIGAFQRGRQPLDRHNETGRNRRC